MPTRRQRLRRSIAILTKNMLLAPIRMREAKSFLAYVYDFDPLDQQSQRIPEVSLLDYFPKAGNETITFKKARIEHGNMTHEELYSICLLARCANPKTIFEFGTFNGNTTLHLALNTSPETQIWTLNLPGPEVQPVFEHSSEDRLVVRPAERSGERFHGEPEARRINELFGDSAIFDYAQFRDSVDLVLVDAGHEYDYVKNDTERAFEMLRPGGWVVWHDYPNAPGVARYLDELAEKRQIHRIASTRLAFSGMT